MKDSFEEQEYKYTMMVLSGASWFQSFLAAACDISLLDAKSIQACSREVVKKMFKYSDTPDFYHGLSWNQTSVDAFWNGYLRCVKEKIGNDIVFNRFLEFCKNAKDDAPLANSKNFFWMICEEEFSSDHSSKRAEKFMSQSVYQVVSKCYESACEIGSYDFDKLSASSKDTWDSYIKKSKPDDPTAFEDYADIHFGEALSAYQLFIAGLLRTLDSQSLNSVRSWIIYEYESLVQEKCDKRPF